ncbi:MAG TPA: heme ABC exporter ATP-binding protein CcmA [Acidimicrobiales bacterium]|nr:heme ABC exporter ATP-binding protein CcmA [Acidimicrobiales bacterium]
MPHAVHLRAAVALAGRFPALSGVDLSVDPGEVVVVVGPNGAGKTSLLRTCAGLLPVTSGEAVVLGCDLRLDRAAVRPRVGLLGHTAPLYAELTAAENVRFAVRAAGLASSRAEPALERLGLVGRLRRTTVERLSAGQRKRVALAALVARSPELWLLDEPHAGLDASARELLAAILCEAAAGGATVLVASHEPEVLRAQATRTVAMTGGRVTGEAPAQPAGLRLAEPTDDPLAVGGGVHVA